jgi:hypothetical protein
MINGNVGYELRLLCKEDCSRISEAFAMQGWNKPLQQYVQYFLEQTAGKRSVFILFINQEFCGYVTVNWHPSYSYFQSHNIPEIQDLNVLKKFQRRSYGLILLQHAEKAIGVVSSKAGIGVGLTADYGFAQRLYIKNGYIPTGFGVTSHNKQLTYGEMIKVDDELILWFTKILNNQSS